MLLLVRHVISVWPYWMIAATYDLVLYWHKCDKRTKYNEHLSIILASTYTRILPIT